MIDYIRQANKNYLRIRLPENEELGYAVKMVENNKIDGLLELSITDVNNSFNCMYDISGKIALSKKYENKEFNASDIEYIVSFIKEMTRKMEKYMLDVDGLLFNPNYIFCDVSSGKWSMVYNKAVYNEARNGIRQLFEFILERINNKDQRAVVLGYGLYKRVCRQEVSFDRILDGTGELSYHTDSKIDVLEVDRMNPFVMPMNMREEAEDKDPRILIGRYTYLVGAAVGGIFGIFMMIFAIIPSINGFISGDGPFYLVIIAAIIGLAFFTMAAFGIYMYTMTNKTIEKEVKVDYIDSEPMVSVTATKSQIDNEYQNITEIECEDGDLTKTQVMNQMDSVNEDDNSCDEKTILLTECKKTRLALLDETGKKGKEYNIDNEQTTLGSGSLSDIVLKIEGISRLHARISREGEMLFIKDMNSTNGTWVNDRKLSIYELCPIKDGDIIRLARTNFEIIDTV